MAPKKATRAARTAAAAPPSVSARADQLAFTAARCSRESAAPGPADRHGFPVRSRRASDGENSWAASSAARPVVVIRFRLRLSAVSVRFGAGSAAAASPPSPSPSAAAARPPRRLAEGGRADGGAQRRGAVGNCALQKLRAARSEELRAAYGSASESCDSSHSALSFETTVCPMSAVRPKVTKNCENHLE